MIEDSVDYTPGPLDRSATFYVAGHRGLVGSAIVRNLEAEGFTNIVGKTSAELDLKNREKTLTCCSFGIPIPVSCTLIKNLLLAISYSPLNVISPVLV